MKSELIVDVQPAEVSIALLEDGRLVSLQKEARDIAYAVGDIYLAKVKKLMPGLNAAFVNVGYEKDAFLHYLDLGPHFATYSGFLKQLFNDRRHLPKVGQLKMLPDIDKHGSVSDTLQAGDELLVQIVKEPISSKGPRLTTEISFTGRFIVLTPFSDKISISQKIKSAEEKMRLRQLMESIKPKNYGVIVRTSAEGKKVAELNHELKTLVEAFEDTCRKAQTSTAPALVFEEQNRVVGVLRDVFNPSFENIHVNDADIHSQILKYVNLIAPERRDIVKLYSKETPIFDNFSVTRQIKSSFGKTVSFKSGAYIIIESTEALHVIDVNSGNRSKAGNDQETNALEVNLRAADEIARQLRLRDMGGIIVVDFIDMAQSDHRQQLFEHMREVMANDRARHNILPLSKFGLMQITRQRVRPALNIETAERCPSCLGKGHVQPSILFTDTLFEKLQYLTQTLGKRDFIMYVHPFVDAYLKKGFFTNLYRTWRSQLGRVFKVLPDESMAYLQFRVVGQDGNEIRVLDEKDAGHSSAAKVADKRRRGEDDSQAEAKEMSDEPVTAKPSAPVQEKAKEKNRQLPKSQPKTKPETEDKPKPKQAEIPADKKQDSAEKQVAVNTKKPKSSKASKPVDEAPVASPEQPAVTPEVSAASNRQTESAVEPQKLPAQVASEETVEVARQLPAPEEPALLPNSGESQDDNDTDDADERENDVTADADESKPKKKRRHRRRKPKTTADGAETPEATDTPSSEE